MVGLEPTTFCMANRPERVRLSQFQAWGVQLPLASQTDCKERGGFGEMGAGPADAVASSPAPLKRVIVIFNTAFPSSPRRAPDFTALGGKFLPDLLPT
jgi:hypothetical protein